jgi:hypothetical protein|tara:strand:+ start:439 stop:738 length:300 start_codon:yes stop_codon:yes gene_type:complete
MIGNLEPEEHIMENSVVDQVARVANKLGWDEGDDIVVEIGGTIVSGIHQGETYNKKWATPFGVRKYNKDAFIIISNNSRRDLSKSQPMDREHKPHHNTK